MVTIAGLFDSMADATNAMDVLLRAHIPDLDTRVFETGSQTDTGNQSPGFVIPLVPATGEGFGTGGTGTTGGAGPVAGLAALSGSGWLKDMSEEERAFYHEGYREGATLAVARVPDEHVDHVRQLLRDHNARTYVRD